MKRMTASTIMPGATTAAVRLTEPGKARPIIPPPAATSTSKNVPKNSEKSRRHSWVGSSKSWIIRSSRCSAVWNGYCPSPGLWPSKRTPGTSRCLLNRCSTSSG